MSVSIAARAIDVAHELRLVFGVGDFIFAVFVAISASQIALIGGIQDNPLDGEVCSGTLGKDFFGMPEERTSNSTISSSVLSISREA